MSTKNKLDSKSKHFILGIFAVLILLTFSVVMLIAAYNYSLNNTEESTAVDMNNNVIYQNPESTTAGNAFVTPPSTTSAETVQSNEENSTSDTTQMQEPISVEGLEEFTKTGDNLISDSPNNEFIKLIVDEKGAKAEYLVAIYAVPDLGNNFVLEFDNKRDENGNIIRSPKTLKKIYHINKERKITVATGKATGNEGVNYGTSIMTYYLVTDVVMPEFPDYFTDVG
ncbi:MAG: hypothetical protein E7557_09615 [Ruminococcaceae bacterium]|nr:hypothetical protein [Oscillospiraceae bacterium]